MKTKKPSKDIEGGHISRTPTPNKLGKRERQPRKIFSPSAYDDRRPVKEEPVSPETSRPSSVNRQSSSNTIDQRGASSSKESVKPAVKSSNQTKPKPHEVDDDDDDDIEILAVKPGRSRREASTSVTTSPEFEVETESNIPEKNIDTEIEKLIRESSPEIFTPSLAERVKRHSAAKANANMLKATEDYPPKAKAGAKKKDTPPKKASAPSTVSTTSKAQDTPKTSSKLPKASIGVDSPSASQQIKKSSVNNEEIKEKGNGKITAVASTANVESAVSSKSTSNQVTSKEASPGFSKQSVTKSTSSEKPAVDKDAPKASRAGSVIGVYKEPQASKNGQKTVENGGNKQLKVAAPLAKAQMTKSAAPSTTSVASSQPHAEKVPKPSAKNEPVPDKKTDMTNALKETPKSAKTVEAENPSPAPANGATSNKNLEATSKASILPKKTEAFATPSRTQDFANLSQIKASKRTDANGKNRLSEDHTPVASSSNGSRTHSSANKNINPVSRDSGEESVQKKEQPENENLEDDHPSLKFTISLKGTPSIHASSEKKSSEIVPKSADEQDSEEGMDALGLEEEYNEAVRARRSGRVRGKDGRWESKAKEQPKILPTFSTPSKLRISSPLKKDTPPTKPSAPEPIILQKESSTDSSQCSASPELGGSGLGFTYSKAKFDYDDIETKDESPEDSPVVRRLRPRKKTIDRANSNDSLESNKEMDVKTEQPKPASSAPYVHRPPLPTPPPQQWYTGAVEEMPAFLDSSELPFSIEKKKCEESARLAIRAALLENIGRQSSGSESPRNVGKWVRPSIDDDGQFQVKDFLPVQAELPQLLPKQLAEFEEDRDVPMWPTPPENFDLYEDQVADYLRMSKKKRVRIDEALRFLHGSCGHNVLQASKTLKDTNLELLTIRSPPPMEDDDEETFCLMYMGYGKHFNKYVKRFPDYTVPDIVEYYYDTKKHFNYKTLVPNNPPDERDLEELRRDAKNFYSGNCHLCKKQDKYLINKDDWYICRTCRFYQNELTEIPRKLKDECARFPQHHQYIDGPCELNLNEFYGVEDFHQDSLVRELKKPTREEIETMVYEEQERLKNLGITTKQHENSSRTKRAKTDSQLGEEFYRRLAPFYRENVPTSVADEIEALEEKLTPLKKNGRKIVLRDVLRNLHKEPIKALIIPKKIRPPKEKYTDEFTEKDYYFAMQGFIRYGLNFELVADVVGNKTPSAMESFYNQSKVNIDKVLGKSNPNPVKTRTGYTKMLAKKNPQLKSTISKKYEVKL